jgi:hypothetical protein
MRTLNGEKYVDDPPPELACWLAIVYWNVVGLGTAVTVNVPLYAPTPTPLITTTSPTERPCGAFVWIVAVVPDELAPGIAGVAVPPPETGSPETALVYWNERVDGTAVTVNVPL